jgi:four helix bundle protein
MKYFDHETLDVYKRALEFLASADDALGPLKKRAYLKNQVQRAALSIVLNIAEGSGEVMGEGKARFFRMARRSATECAAALDAAAKLSGLQEGDHMKMREGLLSVAAMLFSMERISLERGRRRQ